MRTKPAYRPLTEEERTLLTWLLEHNTPEAREFIPLLDRAEARTSCTCGCPSIEFNFPLDLPMVETPRGIIADFSGESDGMAIGLILFSGSGALSELEVFSFGECDHSFGLPSIETLRPFS